MLLVRVLFLIMLSNIYHLFHLLCSHVCLVFLSCLCSCLVSPFCSLYSFLCLFTSCLCIKFACLSVYVSSSFILIVSCLVCFMFSFVNITQNWTGNEVVDSILLDVVLCLPFCLIFVLCCKAPVIISLPIQNFELVCNTWQQ